MAAPGDETVVPNPKPVKIFKNQCCYVEMFEFRDQTLHELHRWNHGLEQDFVEEPIWASEDSAISKKQKCQWTKPHLPSVSIWGMLGLRETLSPDTILLDVQVPEGIASIGMLEPIADAICKRLISGHLFVTKGGLNTRAKRELKAKHEILQQLEVRCSLQQIREREAKRLSESQASKEAAPEPKSADDQSGQGGEFNALKPDNDEEAVQILVAKADWLTDDVVVMVRLASALELECESEESPSSRFILMVMGPSEDEKRRTQIGEATASMFLDDNVVSTAYKASNPCEIISCMENIFDGFRLMPHNKRPTEKGVRKRAAKLLNQMKDYAAEEVETGQQGRFTKMQEDTFKNGLSVAAIMTFMQKFALPLIFGIALAMLWANLDEASYDHWAGVGHGAPAEDGSGHRMLSSGGVERPTVFGLSINGHPITLHFIVNDMLMCLFFGLATKEICEAFQPGGSLYPPTRSTVNVLAATLGGVFGPILVYMGSLALLSAADALGDEYSFADYAVGWGIPTATDISLAWVTALCTFGAGHPAINYLLLLAIVDDGIGLMIIAFAYPDPNNPLQPQWLGLVVVGMLVAFLLRRLRSARWQPYIFLAGPFSWVGFLFTGLHPSLALVTIVPFIPVHVENDLISWLGHGELPADEGHDHGKKHDHGHHPLHEFEEATKTVVDFFVLFAFGALNAGVQANSVGVLTFVVLFALVAGKMLGIAGASYIASKLGCPPPKGMSTLDTWIVGFIASAGLTVALFVSGEAFSNYPTLSAQAKMGALLSILVALVAIFGSTVHRAFFKKKTKCEEDLSDSESVDGDPEDESGDQVGKKQDGKSKYSDDDEMLEDVIVASAVKRLKLLHDVSDVVEKKTRTKSKIKRLNTFELDRVVKSAGGGKSDSKDLDSLLGPSSLTIGV